MNEIMQNHGLVVETKRVKINRNDNKADCGGRGERKKNCGEESTNDKNGVSFDSLSLMFQTHYDRQYGRTQDEAICSRLYKSDKSKQAFHSKTALTHIEHTLTAIRANDT